MNRNHFWKLITIVLVVVWALFEMYPPTDRDLVQVFRSEARNRDPAFNGIIERAQKLAKIRPDRQYGNLQEAVGTNDLARYFPSFDLKSQVNPTTYTLNRLQRLAAGKIRLGIDLKGGTSFLLAMDTNQLAPADIKSVVDQAVEVLRRRVDRFGVAEPIIQPS